MPPDSRRPAYQPGLVLAQFRHRKTDHLHGSLEYDVSVYHTHRIPTGEMGVYVETTHNEMEDADARPVAAEIPGVNGKSSDIDDQRHAALEETPKAIVFACSSRKWAALTIS